MTPNDPDKEICPACGELAELSPRGDWYECPDCGLEGCEACIPGGNGCSCVACEAIRILRLEDQS